MEFLDIFILTTLLNTIYPLFLFVIGLDNGGPANSVLCLVWIILKCEAI